MDEELDRDNTSIENQKAIIEDFVKRRFPGSALTFYEDRDRSGYTFEQREGYRKMRRELVEHRLDILVVKDFSRFSRRNSRGLVELEDLRDAGVRIISIGDNIDFPNDDDWLKIQFQFLINEMPVTDASKKVKSVIRRRQEDGKWICAAPYGYIVNQRQEFEVVPTEAQIVRDIFQLYISGWGYKRIANYLTDEGVPTPRMSERQRREAEGLDSTREARREWAIMTVESILKNDFYIGTLRQGKYTRGKINGRDVKRDAQDHIVIENHHQAVIDYRTFAIARAQLAERTTAHYRGQKKYDNAYSGFLECGDCGSPMFAMSRADLRDAYRCGLYHRRGLKGCTSHHIRVDKLDELLKIYVRKVRDNSSAMLDRLNRELESEREDVAEAERAAANLEEVLRDLREELRATKRQRIRDIMRHPDREEALEETYDELEDDLLRRIEGIENQLRLTEDRRNTIIRVNRAAKTAMEVFDDILSKEKLDRNDIQLIVKKIRVFEDHIEVQLRADIDSLLQCGTLPANANFEPDMADNAPTAVIQSSVHHGDKVYHVHVVSDGDPLEIYTEKDGEVIFKKYSPMGELSDFAGQMCETLSKSTGLPAAICDRDTVIAVCGVNRRELYGKAVSPELEAVMEGRQVYHRGQGEKPMSPADGAEKYAVTVAAPILTEGDVMGCVLFFAEGDSTAGEVEYKLAQTVAGFLGKQMEN